MNSAPMSLRNKRTSYREHAQGHRVLLDEKIESEMNRSKSFEVSRSKFQDTMIHDE